MTDTDVKANKKAATGKAASGNVGALQFGLRTRVAALLFVLGMLSSFGSAQSTDEQLTATQIPRAGELRIPQADMLQNVATVPESQTLRNVEQILNRRGNAIFRDTAISEVIYTLSQQWGINIVAGAEVSGTVSGVFRDASLREILDALLTVNGYGYRQNGANLLVMRLDQIGPNNPNFRAETFLLPPAISGEAVDQVVTALRVFSSANGGQIQAIPSTNTLMVYDTPDKILQMQQMLQNLSGMRTLGNAGSVAQSGASNMPFAAGMVSSGAEILKLRPQFVPVSEIAKAVELAVGTSGTYVTIEGEQVVLVSGPPEILRRAESVFQQVDQPRAQVRITAYIYDVSLGELERLGIDWSNQIMSQSVDSNGIPMRQIRADAGLVNRNPATGLVGAATTVGSNAAGGAAGGAAAGATTATANGGQWVFRTLSNNFELNTVLQALDETKGAKLLADPHVTVVDRQKAEINIVTKIPIQQLTQTQQGGSIGTTAFEEAGIKMDVTPRIASDGTVEMQVVPEFSVLTGFNSTGQPIIDARRASTTVRVAHQQTLVIGGLRQKTAVETVRGIPGLMNWKYIGRLFQTHNTEMRESELIVFIQPEIVNYEWTGLQREANAIATQKAQLSTIPTACPGPWVPNCRDPHCPHHCPRPRPNPGEYDDGYVMPASVPQAMIQQPSSMSVYRPQQFSSDAAQGLPIPNQNAQPTSPLQLQEDVLSTEPRMPTVPQNTEGIPQAGINNSTRKGLIVPAKIITN